MIDLEVYWCMKSSQVRKSVILLALDQCELSGTHILYLTFVMLISFGGFHYMILYLYIDFNVNYIFGNCFMHPTCAYHGRMGVTMKYSVPKLTFILYYLS